MKNKRNKFRIKVGMLAVIATIIVVGFFNGVTTNTQSTADNFFKAPIAHAADSDAVKKAKEAKAKAEAELKNLDCKTKKTECDKLNEQIAAANKTIGLTAPSGGSSSEFQKLMNDAINTLNLISEFLQRLIWPVLLLIGGLLKNDILFGAGMEETMLNIWRNIRNIVNILFVIILLGIAFYNVMGGGSQDYHIKTILPKFIIALIAVNFSFLMVKVVIDGVSVVTTAFFALPSAVEQNLAGEKKSTDLASNADFEKKVCEGLYLKGNNYEPPDEDAMCEKTQRVFTKDAKSFFGKYDANNAAIVLAINFGEISEIKKVTLSGTTDAVRGLFLNSLFSVVIYIVYATAFVALLIILAVRLVTLWVTMVLSPLIVLSFVVPESLKSSLGGASELSKKFVKSAIAPIPIALMMSIGFIMINAWKQARFPGQLGASTAGLELLTSGLSTLQDLIAAVSMVVVIWMGVFEAANGTYAEKAVQGLKGAVEGAGKFIVTAPFKYMPIVPMKEGEEAVSLGAVTGALGQIPAKMRGRHMKEQERVLDHMGIGATPLEKAIKEASDGKALAKAAANGDWTNKAQTDIGNKLKDKKWRTSFFGSINKIKLDGKEYNQEELARAMENGQLSAKAVDQLSKRLETVHRGKSSLPEADKPEAGTTGTDAALRSVPMSETFNNDQKKIIENEFKGKTEPERQANKQAAKKLRDAATAADVEKGKFMSGMQDGSKSAADKVEVIKTAKTNLKKHFRDMGSSTETEAEGKANEIIDTEIKRQISGYESMKERATDAEKQQYDKQIETLKGQLTPPKTQPEPPATK